MFKVTVKSETYNKLVFHAEKMVDVYGLLQTTFQYGQNVIDVTVEEIKEGEEEEK